MKALSPLLLLPALGLLVSSKSLCPVEEAISEMMQAQTSSLIAETLKKVELACSSVSSRGPLATCPAGFAVTGCACGKACGSWDVRGDTTCHCQCADMDWTAARCCRLRGAAGGSAAGTRQ